MSLLNKYKKMVEEMLMTVLFRNKCMILTAYSLLSGALVVEASASNLFGYPEEQKAKVDVKKRQGTPYVIGGKSRIRITSPIKVIKPTPSQPSDDEQQSTRKPRAIDFTFDKEVTLKEKSEGIDSDDFLGGPEKFDASGVHDSDLGHECSISPIRPAPLKNAQTSPIPHYMGMMAEHTISDDENELLEEPSEEQESFERKHYTKAMWEEFYQGLQVGIATVFPPTKHEFALMNDGYIYELIESKLIALFKQSDPEFDWETLLAEEQEVPHF